MCLECSGKHRNLGVHISFVRSGEWPFSIVASSMIFLVIVTMDSWNDKQIQAMRCGGNDKLNDFLMKYDVTKLTSISTKYNSPAAKLFKERCLHILVIYVSCR